MLYVIALIAYIIFTKQFPAELYVFLRDVFALSVWDTACWTNVISVGLIFIIKPLPQTLRHLMWPAEGYGNVFVINYTKNMCYILFS